MTLPTPGPLDVATAALLAAAYVAAGAYGLILAPRDVRARAFGALAIANVLFAFLPFGKLDRVTIVAAICVAAFGSVALFHFAMVFPWRQPWLRGRGGWLAALYLFPPVIVLVLNWYAPASAEELSVTDLLVLSAAGIPLVVLLAVVLPLAALLALFANIRRARTQGPRAAYVPTLGIFISELGGGLLAAVLGVLLQTLGFGRVMAAAVTLSVFALNVLAPLAFAAGVGRYRVLSLDLDAI